MKLKQPKFLIVLLVLLLLLSISVLRMNRGQSKTDIISWFIMDIDNDGKEELLVITKRNIDEEMVLDSGVQYGNDVKIYSDYIIDNNFPVTKDEPDDLFDFTDIKPIKIQAGDINGDGEVEIAVCVYKTAEFHPVFSMRPFFYRLVDGELEPVWLGSRLARPFDDYVLFDIDEDGIEEIVSIELLRNGNRILAIYDWKGFGFEVKTISEELEGMITFIDNINYKEDNVIVEIVGQNHQMILDNNEMILTEY